MLSVVSAILRPWPSFPITFSAGTKTSVEPRDRVLDPAQAHERVAVLDRDAVGVSYGRTNAVMPPRWPSDFGTCAITTTMSAIAPLVAHSLSPLST